MTVSHRSIHSEFHKQTNERFQLIFQQFTDKRENNAEATEWYIEFRSMGFLRAMTEGGCRSSIIALD